MRPLPSLSAATLGLVVVVVMCHGPKITSSFQLTRFSSTGTILKRHPPPLWTNNKTLRLSQAEENLPETSISELLVDNPPRVNQENIWEQMASAVYNVEEDPTKLREFVQLVTVLRVGIPSLLLATTAKLIYPSTALWLAALIDDSGAFAVISQDSSQYIQNILTTSGLVFSLLVGQTYYFMYQQQEAIYLALYQEVTMAKSLLEQIGLVSQGRTTLYKRILQCMDHYVQEDLHRFNDVEPAVMLSARPVDDPLEDILYLTSVGEPSIVYQTVRSLRQARAYRLGALQKKLPSIHMTLLWSLAAIVLCSFPLLGAGAQTIGGTGILNVQAWYLSFIVFGICLIMGVVYELQMPGRNGAYNARAVLQVMVAGLEEELKLRLSGDFVPNTAGPTLDINRPASSVSQAALLPLGTAQEVLQASEQASTIVDVTPASTGDTTTKDSETKSTEKKKGFRSKVKTWAFDMVQNSITKFK
ncbi:expressed unknown protein [Seminavis robusta]|uniref:Uncharacterized protein n=1 Tax=Seminavis robusta TaxID=568900 RepID=A0A9N8EBD7_9STRA|nr:expressed unknown protein [Seminavis robusta]|eukprot:Sro716_g191940.1 n/a (473) ;mRNA; f:45270-46688